MKVLLLKSIIADMKTDEIEKYLVLLHQLTQVYQNATMLEKMKNSCKEYVLSLPSPISIYVLLDKGEIIASATLIIENKIIHNFGRMGHIEDVVVDHRFQGKGYGKKMVQYLIKKAEEKKCYKIILNCTDEKVKFYEKCGFERRSQQMGIYFDMQIKT